MFCRTGRSTVQSIAQNLSCYPDAAARNLRTSARGEVRETAPHVRDDLEGAIEMRALVGRHQAGPEESAARRDGWVEGDVGVDAGLEECLPDQDGLPVLSDDHRDHGGGWL